MHFLLGVCNVCKMCALIVQVNPPTVNVILVEVCNGCRTYALGSGQSKWQPQKLAQRVEMLKEKDEEVVSY